MADVGVYGALGGLGQEIRSISKEQSDRQWQTYLNSVQSAREENLARLRHSLDLERDKATHKRELARMEQAHKMGIAGEEEKLKLRQEYPSLSAQNEAAKMKAESQKCDETYESGGNWWCRKGTQHTLMTRKLELPEKQAAQQGLISREMGAYADVEDYLPGLEREFQAIEGAEVPVPYPAQTSKGRSKASAAGGGLKTADSSLFLKAAGGLYGAQWDPVSKLPIGLNREQGEQVQAIADYAEQLFKQAEEAGKPITRLAAVSEAARQLFNINIKRPPAQGLLGGAMGSGQQQPTRQLPQPNDPLGLGL